MYFLSKGENDLKLSYGAIGDLKKHDNNINGYLIDIRRTMWDTMCYKDMKKVDDNLFTLTYSNTALIDKINKLTQWVLCGIGYILFFIKEIIYAHKFFTRKSQNYIMGNWACYEKQDYFWNKKNKPQKAENYR